MHATSMNNVTKEPKVVSVDDKHEQRVKNLQKIMVPLIEAGFNRAEIIRQGVSGGDFLFMEKHAPAIFKDHRQYITLKKHGLREDYLEQLAAPYEKSWREFKMKFDSARHMTVFTRKKQWQLTFLEWFTIWSQSGAWRAGNINERPRYGMLLIDQDLPYQVGNVRIVPVSLMAQKGWLIKHRNDSPPHPQATLEDNA